MTCTSNRSTRISGRERSGVFQMRSRRRSRNWVPFRNSKRQPSWASSWKPGFPSRSSLRGRTSALSQKSNAAFALGDPRGRGSRPHGLKEREETPSCLHYSPLGQIVATPGALAALERANQPPTCFLARHAIGDWGELEPSDAAENPYGVSHRL